MVTPKVFRVVFNSNDISNYTIILFFRIFLGTSEILFILGLKTNSINFTRKKDFVIPTKSFVKKGITKIFCYNNKMFGCCGKIFG